MASSGGQILEGRRKIQELADQENARLDRLERSNRWGLGFGLNRNFEINQELFADMAGMTQAADTTARLAHEQQTTMNGLEAWLQSSSTLNPELRGVAGPAFNDTVSALHGGHQNAMSGLNAWIAGSPIFNPGSGVGQSNEFADQLVNRLESVSGWDGYWTEEAGGQHQAAKRHDRMVDGQAAKIISTWSTSRCSKGDGSLGRRSIDRRECIRDDAHREAVS
jgi:hypothetical protein